MFRILSSANSVANKPASPSISQYATQTNCSHQLATITAKDRLFTPLALGPLSLSHRGVLAPLTRFRASATHTPLPIVVDYYTQRASTPGTLLITEATLISPRASGEANVPGIWSREHIAAWKQVTDAVHARKCFIFLQLWALGRRAKPRLLEGAEGGPYPVVSSSTIPISEGGAVPKALEEEEIQLFIDDFATAAKNAMQAGFDGVEIHGANGYLLDQFLQASINQRSDAWGGNDEKRSRFVVEPKKAVVEMVGESSRVAVRLSPWSHYDGSSTVDGKVIGKVNGSVNGDNNDTDGPVSQFCHTIAALTQFGLAYLHLVESRYAGSVAEASYYVLTRRNDVFIDLWCQQTNDSPIILAGGFTPETARKAVNEVYRDVNMCIAFGRSYISTPDLPFRVKRGLKLNKYDRATFYEKMSERGYVDYAFSEEYLAIQDGMESGVR